MIIYAIYIYIYYCTVVLYMFCGTQYSVGSSVFQPHNLLLTLDRGGPKTDFLHLDSSARAGDSGDTESFIMLV